MTTQPKPYPKATKLNARQHQVAINIASGMGQGISYQIVYHCDHRTAIERASQLLATNTIFKATVERLKKRKEELSLAKMAEDIMSPHERKTRLSEIARARLVEFQGEDGTPKLTKDTPNNAAAKEFYHKSRVDRDGNPIITRSIKLTDPIAAIQELNKMDGSYAPSRYLVAGKHRVVIEYAKKPIVEEEEGTVTAEGEATGGEGN